MVLIVVGSDSDLPVIKEGAAILEKLGVPYELTVASAHRTPDHLRSILKRCHEEGVEVFIAGAGGAAHLPGVVAAETIKPVIGVPMESESLKGLDSLLSIAQMPGGVPVACMAIGKAGARNAALHAAAILSLSHEDIRSALTAYRAAQRDAVIEKSRSLSVRWTKSPKP